MVPANVPTVLIAGGGISGLFCALECKRHGFMPSVLESRGNENNLAGDFITIGCTATRAFANHSAELFRCVQSYAFDPHTTWYRASGEHGAGPRKTSSKFGTIISRPRLHQALHEAVRAAGIDVQYHSRVRHYFEDDRGAGVKLEDGRVLEADLVVAADGVHSSSWKIVTGRAPRAYRSGSSIFRAAFSTEHALKSDIIKSKINLQKDEVSFFIGQSSHAIAVTGPSVVCYNWVHDDKHGTASESWNKTLSAEEALRQLGEAGIQAPQLHELVRLTPPKTIVDWQLIWRDLDEEWVSPKGRIVQIGDAAHPFLPTSVNGGTQALEDAASLPACLRYALDRDVVAGVPQATRVHNKLRFERVCCIQRLGVARKVAYRAVDWDAAKKDASMLENPPPLWISEHDPERYAVDNYDDCARCIEGGARFRNTNIPFDFHYKPVTLRELDPSLQDMADE